MKSVFRTRKGFTLIEIMIVVLIIAILLAIAVPNFMKSREMSRATTCQANLRSMDTAKEHWAMENRKGPGDTPSSAELITEYMRARNEDALPPCPTSGVYALGDMAARPSCTIGANGAGTSDDHMLN